MGILVSSTDFTGYYKLPINTRNTSELNEVISLKERLYLNKVLGVDLAQLFIDDLTNQVPVTQIYLDIYNAIQIDYQSSVIQNNGMKEMIKGFIYAEFIDKQEKQQTTVGAKHNDSANAQMVGAQGGRMQEMFNEAVNSSQVIQHYINTNWASYPDYNGQEINFALWV